jgi:hypothetical protein
MKIKDFLIEVLTCRKKIKKLEENQTNPEKIIANIIGRGIDWYDYEKLDSQEQLSYYLDIQRVLTNTAFENEVKHFLGDLIQEIAVSAAEVNKDKMLRFSINGVKTLLERLEAISDPREEVPTSEDINSYV